MISALEKRRAAPKSGPCMMIMVREFVAYCCAILLRHHALVLLQDPFNEWRNFVSEIKCACLNDELRFLRLITDDLSLSHEQKDPMPLSQDN